MKLTFRSYGNVQTATTDGIKVYEFEAGKTADVPDDVAALFLSAGVAEPAKAERAVKPKGETADK